MGNATNLTIHFNKLTVNFDPQKMIDARSMQVNLQIHRGLFRYLPNGDIVPDLASSWEFSPDHLKLIVNLKKSSFSNGNQIKSKHVVNTFKRMFAISSGISADLSGLVVSKVGAEKIEVGVKELSPERVEFKLNTPNSVLIQQLATVDCSILEIENESDEPNVKIGAGPYKIINYDVNKLILEKWRNDAVDSIKSPQKVLIHFINESSVDKLISEYQVDSLDQMNVGQNDEVKLFEKKWFKTVTDMTKENFLIINPNKFSSEERKYIMEQIDVVKITSQLGNPFIPAFGLVPPVLSGSMETKLVFEKSKIKQMRKTIEILIPDTWDYKDILVSAFMKTIDPNKLKIKFKVISFDLWNKAKFKKEFDLLLNARGIDYPDGISILNYFKSGVEGNFYFSNDPELDKSLNLSVQEFDPSKRQLLYRKIQEKILEQNVVLPLFFGSRASGFWGPKVKFVPPHPLGYHFLPFETIEMR